MEIGGYEEKKERIRGDMRRELMFLMYLNNKYGFSNRIKVSKLKKTTGYSTGGIYGSLKESDFFEMEGDEIKLSQKGKTYVEKEFLPYFRAFHPIGYLLIVLGIFFFLHWYLRTYFNIIMVVHWYVGFVFIAAGLIMRFALLRLLYLVLKIKKKI